MTNAPRLVWTWILLRGDWLTTPVTVVSGQLHSTDPPHNSRTIHCQDYQDPPWYEKEPLRNFPVS